MYSDFVLCIISACFLNEPPTIGEIAHQLKELEQTSRSLRTTYSLKRYYQRPVSSMPDLTESDVAESYEIDWLSSGALFRVERHVGSLTDQRQLVQSTIWNGEFALFEDIRQQSYIVSRQPNRNEHLGVAYLFHGIKGPSLIGRRPLSDLVQVMPLTSIELKEPFVYLHFNIGPDKTLIQITLTMGTPVRVEEVVLTVLGGSGAGDFKGKPVGKIRYWVEEWGTYDDLILPVIAHRDGYVFDHVSVGSGNPVFTRHTFSRISASDVSTPPPNSSEFQAELKSGFTLHDERYGLLYVVDDDSIVLDGISYRLSRPFNPLVENYREFIIRDEPDDSDPSDSNPQLADSVFPSKSLLRAMAVGTLTCCISGILIYCARRFRNFQ